MATDDRLGAVAPLAEASAAALEVGDFSLAVEAWARRAWCQGTALGEVGALSALDVIEAVAAQRSVTAFARALLHNNVGSVQLALERRDEARASFERAAREAEGVSGRGATELLNVGQNLALVIDDPARRDRVLAAAVTAKARVLGDDHPETLETLRLRGTGQADPRRAVELLLPACSGLEKHDDPRGAYCWAEVGFLRGELGDGEGALAALDRAEATRAKDGRQAPVVLPFLELARGHVDAATRQFERALAALPSTPADPWWARWERADLELGLGRALRAGGRAKEAKRALARSLPVLTDVARAHPGAGVERRVAAAQAELEAFEAAPLAARQRRR
jgi:tetratricopeptide (TPR) repeat protein